MSENKTPGQFPIPGLALVVLLIGVWAISDPPFKPSRPAKSPELTSTAEDVTARLWQDPFQAVELHRRQKHKPEQDDDKVSGQTSKLSENTLFQDSHHRPCGINVSSLSSFNNSSK